MLTEAINYPRQSDSWVKTVLVGGVLAFFAFLVVPAILVIGYLVRVLRAAMQDDDQPPVFDDWGDLATDGLKGFVVAFVYGIVPSIVAGVFLGGAALAALGGDSGAVLGGGLAMFGLLIAFVLGLLAAYVVPAAVANYAEKGTIGAGFSVSDLRPILLSGKYATAWATGFAVFLAAGLVTGVLSVIPILGTFVGAFVTFYALVVAYYIIGTAWRDLGDVDLNQEEVPDEQPAV